MAAKLTVRKELLDSEIHFDQDGISRKVTLKVATPEQLAIFKDLGVDIFEPEKPQKE